MELLINKLQSINWRTRVKAAYELGEIGDPSAIFPLIETLLDDEKIVRDSAVEALGKMGQPAVMPLINILSDQNNCYVTDEVSKVLIEFGKPAVKPLIKLLHNCNDIIFSRVAYVLGQIGNLDAVLPLINALEEGNVSVRLDAIKALGQIGDKRATVPIINDIKKHGSSYGSSINSIIALGKLADSTAIPTLINMLRGKDRWVAAKSLGMIGKDAVNPLTLLLKDKEINNQGLVVAALGYTGTAEAVKPLITMLKDEDCIVSWRAAAALVEIGEAAVDPLVQMLNEKNDYIKKLVVDSLGKIGEKRGVNSLNKLLENEKNEEIQKMVYKVLERLQPKNVFPYAEKNINLEKDIFILELGLMERFFRAALAEDMLYLSPNDIAYLKKGELNLPIPVPYQYSGGRTKPEDFIWTDSGFIVSDRIRDLFTVCNFTGWRTFPISLYDKSGNLINGYYGFAVTGKVGPMDYSRSEIVIRPPIVLGKPNIVKKGLYFDVNSWDGSDFINAGYLLVTSRVVDALRKVRPKVKNWEAIPSSQYEISIILDATQPGFLTEADRDKVNELRQAYKEEHKENLTRTAEMMAQMKIDHKPDFLHLLKSIIQNQCMFASLSNQSICQGVLKSLSETGEKEITQLIDALTNKDQEIRAVVAWVLGKLKVSAAIEPLLKALKDRDEHVRREVVMALGELNDIKTVMPLIEMLENEDSTYVRCGIVEVLGIIGDQRAFQPLIHILNNEEEVSVLCNVASALGILGNPKAVFPLIELFKHEDSNLAERIKLALVNIRQSSMIPLIQSLDNDHPLVRGRVAWTLGHMFHKSAVLPLIDRLAIEKDPEVLTYIVETLGQLGDKRAVKPILNISNTTNVEYLHAEAKIAIQKLMVK